jgi:tripartite-type tricarboxylate transporter receptor subunit TctC
LGQHPVPRRRRHHQRGAVGIDADRVPRHAELHLPPAGRHHERPGGRRGATLAAVPRHSDPGRARYRGNLTRVYFALVAPAGTPRAIVNKIREDVARIGNEPGFRKKQFIDRALEPILDTPEEFARFLVEDRVTSGRVVTEAGLQPQ